MYYGMLRWRTKGEDRAKELGRNKCEKIEGKKTNRAIRNRQSPSWTLITADCPWFLLNPIYFFYLDVWTLVNFKMDKKASRIRSLSTCNLERFADQGTSNRIDSISKTSYQTDHKMHIFFLTRFQSLDEENLIVHAVHVFMMVWCAYAHGSASKDSAFCVDLCHQLHAYHVFCVCCMHGHVHLFEYVY